MSIERDAMKGRQAVRKQQIMELVVEINALSGSIRTLLAPDIPVRDRKVAQAKSMMDRMADLDLERSYLQSEYDETEKELA